jgi:hypothetical protein
MATNEVRVTVVPKTDELASALDIIAKHAKACAEELRAARQPEVGYLFAADPAGERS